MSIRHSSKGCSVIQELQNTLNNIGKKEEDVSWYALAMRNQDINSYHKDPVDIVGESNIFQDLENSDFPKYYDDGYGLQYLYGTVVFNDGTWLERCEYDGSEWWEYKCLPNKEKYSDPKNYVI